MMKGFEDGDDRQKTIINLDRQNTEENLEKVINFSKKTIYKDCVWDDLERKFKFYSVLLTPFLWKKITDFQKDFTYETGIYTYYFWRLHCMHHMFQILLIVLQNLKGKMKTLFFKKIGHLPLQIIEMSVLFKDYGAYFVP